MHFCICVIKEWKITWPTIVVHFEKKKPRRCRNKYTSDYFLTNVYTYICTSRQLEKLSRPSQEIHGSNTRVELIYKFVLVSFGEVCNIQECHLNKSMRMMTWRPVCINKYNVLLNYEKKKEKEKESL